MMHIFTPAEIRALTPEDRHAYIRTLAQRAAEENREALDMLAAYDRGEWKPMQRWQS